MSDHVAIIKQAADALGAEIATATEGAEFARSECDRLTGVATAAVAERDRAIAEAAGLRSQVSTQAATITSLQEACDSQKRTIDSQAATIAELKAQASRDALTIAELTRQRDAAQKALADHLATHAPVPAEPISTPPLTVTLSIAGSAPETFKLAREARRDPFNGTERYDMPLKGGLVAVLLDTKRHAHASHVVEYRKPGVFGAALPLLDYTVTIEDPRYGLVATETVTGHGQWQRWRKQNKPWPRGEYDPRLAFSVDPRNAPGAAVNKVPAVPEVTPLFTGGLKVAMGTTGLRNDIGTHTAWLAKAIRTGTDADWASALRSAEAAASIPWHVRDDAGRMVILTGPENLKRMTRTNYATPLPLDRLIDENVGWILDQAHAPKVAWTGRVANSQDTDPYWIEELQFEAAAMINQTHPISKGPDGLLITNDQGRDWTWGMVSLVHALSVTPEVVPDWLLPRSTWQAIIDANLATILPHVGGLAFDRISVQAVDPKYGSETKGVIKHQSFIVDYVPVAMLHCHRLTGDARFKTIGVRHMDARIAKRWKASPKYAYLYAPVTQGDGTTAVIFPTWEAAYKAWGPAERQEWIDIEVKRLVASGMAPVAARQQAEATAPTFSRESDETTPWASFTRPTGSEAGGDGKPMMTYGDPFLAYYLFVADLYVRAGWGTPDIQWLATFLEGKRGKSVVNLVEQLAVAP